SAGDAGTARPRAPARARDDAAAARPPPERDRRQLFAARPDRDRARPELRRQLAALQPGRAGGGLPLLDRLVHPQRELDDLDRGRARRGLARAGRLRLLVGQVGRRGSGLPAEVDAMIKQAPTRGRLTAMIVFALSCFGILLYLWTSFGGSIPLEPKGYRYEVDFGEATQLTTNADVR